MTMLDQMDLVASGSDNATAPIDLKNDLNDQKIVKLYQVAGDVCNGTLFSSLTIAMQNNDCKLVF
jgi:hypothetical protein